MRPFARRNASRRLELVIVVLLSRRTGVTVEPKHSELLHTEARAFDSPHWLAAALAAMVEIVDGLATVLVARL